MSGSSHVTAGLLFAVAVFLFTFSGVYAMNSATYQINWDSVNSGGNDVSTSTNYLLRDTIGEQATGFSSSTDYTISAGYRVGDQDLPSLTFFLGTQENSTQTAYSSFSSSSKAVVVSSVASFSVGDLIGVVENQGLTQRVAIGRILSIAGTTITVDAWDGVPALLSATPAGGDDYVYRMDGSSAALGTLSVTAGKTSLTGTRVNSNAQNGYTVYVNVDGDLRVSTSTFITNVTDGTVTIGSEEYGAQVYGSMATGTGSDFAFSTSTRAIQTSTAIAPTEERTALVYKATIATNTPAGNYSQKVYYTVTPNY